MQDIEDKERYINTGRLIHILSNQMKRRNASEAVGDDGLTTMQKHVLKLFFWKRCTGKYIRKI